MASGQGVSITVQADITRWITLNSLPGEWHVARIEQ